MGKNFVFDRRGQLDARGHGMKEGATSRAEGCVSSRSNADVDASIVVVGRCLYCGDPYDVFRPECVCTVCREPVLACDRCRSDLRQGQEILRGLLAPSSKDKATASMEISCRAEYHCEGHFHLNKCYFTCLHGFCVADCNEQLERLRLFHQDLEGMGRKGRNSRRTLRRQMEKIEAYVRQMLSSDADKNANPEAEIQCRHCGSYTCASDCWGFHGGKTRMDNMSRKNHCENGHLSSSANSSDNVDSERLNKQRARVSSNQRPGKRLKRQNDTLEIEMLQLWSPPSRHRNDSTSLRVPPPVVRTLKSGVKGRWCGKTVRWVLMNEFGEFSRGLTREQVYENIERVIVAGLVRINGVPVKSSDVVLQNMDTLERIVHWHEPPIIVPQKISLTKQILPGKILPNEFKSTDSSILYCINKPSSVPVHPAGPYYANSLLLMVEAQEGLPPKTLIPLHRIDRVTSGLLLCADASSVAKVIQANTINKSDESNPPVRKLYLARVKGKFPATSVEGPTMPKELSGIASIVWCGDDANIIEVNAPIAVQLEPNEDTPRGSIKENGQLNSMMHRTVSSNGKHSTSRFKLISYDASSNNSLVSCSPITGRGHQLRVHLQLIGFPIHNDVEYGGTVNVENLNEQKNLSARSMWEAASATSTCRHEETITSTEVESALQLCKCCIGGLDGIKASFNTAQLLAGGHSIDLHAYKYCLYFQEKGPKNRKQTESVGEESVASIEMTTDLPPWASSFVDLMSNTLTWLN